MILSNIIFPILTCTILFIIISMLQQKSKHSNLIRKFRFALGVTVTLFLLVFLFTSTPNLKSIISLPILFIFYFLYQLYKKISIERL